MTTSKAATTPEAWCSKRSVAAHYDVSVRTIERWVFEGCRSRLIGGVRRLRLSEVETFLEAREASDGP